MVDQATIDEWRRIAHWVTRRYGNHGVDDPVEVIVAELWDAHCRQGVLPSSLIFLIARRALITEARRTGPCDRHGHRRRPQLAMYPTSVRHTAHVEQGYSAIECADLLAQLAVLPARPRDRLIVGRYLAGELLADIGTAHGVTEARVSQIISKWRRQAHAQIKEYR
jgi:DNA-directed RNA polymerase specialized sigma24 family protein